MAAPRFCLAESHKRLRNPMANTLDSLERASSKLIAMATQSTMVDIKDKQSKEYLDVLLNKLIISLLFMPRNPKYVP